MAGGRPLKFETPAAFLEKAMEYFETTPITDQCVTGLALFLDTSRETLCNYQGRPEYFDAVKKVKDKIEHAYELRGMKRGTAFDIFALKNMGWIDKQVTDVHINPLDKLAAALSGEDQDQPGSDVDDTGRFN